MSSADKSKGKPWLVTATTVRPTKDKPTTWGMQYDLWRSPKSSDLSDEGAKYVKRILSYVDKSWTDPTEQAKLMVSVKGESDTLTGIHNNKICGEIIESIKRGTRGFTNPASTEISFQATSEGERDEIRERYIHSARLNPPPATAAQSTAAASGASASTA